MEKASVLKEAIIRNWVTDSGDFVADYFSIDVIRDSEILVLLLEPTCSFRFICNSVS